MRLFGVCLGESRVFVVSTRVFSALAQSHHNDNTDRNTARCKRYAMITRCHESALREASERRACRTHSLNDNRQNCAVIIRPCVEGNNPRAEYVCVKHARVLGIFPREGI